MKLICGVLAFAAAFTLSNAMSAVTLKRINTDQLLVKNLMLNRASSYTSECFGLYLPIFDAILQEFSTSYLLCEKNAQDQKNVLSDEAAGNRTEIIATSDDVCSSMSDCASLSDSLNFLDCYGNVGGNNVKTLYSLTNNASALAATLRSEYQKVEYNQEVCQNASERAYAENSIAAKEALNECLLNGPPEIVTTTTAPGPTSTPLIETTTEFVGTTGVEALFEEEELSRTLAGIEEEDLSRSVQAAAKINPKTIVKPRLRRGNN